jgi:hypothetical protein
MEVYQDMVEWAMELSLVTAECPMVVAVDVLPLVLVVQCLIVANEV